MKQQKLRIKYVDEAVHELLKNSHTEGKEFHAEAWKT